MHQRIRKICITGGAGFIGSAFVRQAVAKGMRVIIIDKLTYAGDLKRLGSARKKIKIYKTDIGRFPLLEKIFKKERPETVVHFAAETHVDRSILRAADFVTTNVTGTQNLIDLSRQYGVKKFLHISTDEVYGDSKTGTFTETAPVRPNNPYSATKAAAEMLVKAAIRTHGFPAIIIRPANNYGPWQYPEKLIPVVVLKAFNNQRVPVYGRGQQIREWLYVEDCAEAVHLIARKGKIGEVYNIGSYHEQNNLTTVKGILKTLGKPHQLIQFVKDRPGHDFRYSVNCTKLKRLGWRPRTSFSEGIIETVQWYLKNIAWMNKKQNLLEQYWKKVYKP